MLFVCFFVSFSYFSQSLKLFFNLANITNSYFMDHKGDEQLKGKTGIGATE